MSQNHNSTFHSFLCTQHCGQMFDKNKPASTYLPGATVIFFFFYLMFLVNSVCENTGTAEMLGVNAMKDFLQVGSN